MLSGLLAALVVRVLLTAAPDPRRVATVLERPSRRGPPPAALAGLLVVLAAVVLAGPGGGLVLGVPAGLVAARVVSSMEPAATRRRREQVLRALPDAVDLLVGLLDAGRPPQASLALVAHAARGPLADDLGAVADRLAVVADHDVAWRGTTGPVADLGRCFVRAERTGAPVGVLLRHLADELRRARRAAATARARSVGARTAAPLGLCFLPAFFAIGVAPTIVGGIAALLP